MLLLAMAVCAVGCSVERSGLLTGVGASDLGTSDTDLGGSDGATADTDLGMVEADLGAVEVDGGTPPGTCDPALCPGRYCEGGLCAYARSCNALHTATPSLPDGVYTLDGDGPDLLEPADTYCDMTNDAGGWTLVLKADGSMSTFRYDSTYWVDDVELAGSAMYDRIEAKLRTFRTVGFTQVRIVMVTGSETHALVLDAGGTSCVQLFNGPSVTTAIARDTWLAMVPDVSLQDNCGRQGTNVAPAGDQARVRIGIIGNNENNCDSSNSRIGIGGAAENDAVTTGNIARWNGWGNDRDTVSFGYVFVR